MLSLKSIPTRKIMIAAAIAVAVVMVWYGWREYNTQRFLADMDALGGFDMDSYKSRVTDTTNWDNYEPLSLEVP